MLRYRLALPWLLAHRLLAAAAPTRAGFRILIFHGIAENRFAAFERLLGHVKRRHGVIAPEEAEAMTAAAPSFGRRRRPPCLFSFDDGFSSNLALAQGVLAQHGVKALFFVCPGLVDLSGENQRAAIAANIHDGRLKGRDLAPGARLLTWTEIEELTRMGHAVGAHGLTHRRLSRLDGGDLRNEIVGAGRCLEQRLGRPVRWYAFAFGDADSVSEAALRIIGENFRLCRSGVRGANGPGTHRLALRADAVDLDAPFAYQQLILEGGLDVRYRPARARLDGLAAAAG